MAGPSIFLVLVETRNAATKSSHKTVVIKVESGDPQEVLEGKGII